MRALALVAALILGACGSTLADRSPSPTSTRASATPPASASASAAPTGRLPGSVVRITVNGLPYVDGTGFALVPTGRPVTIVLTFPFAVDRASVERWFSNPSPITWTDDRIGQLTFKETEPIGFKVAETRAATGDAVIDYFTVNVDFPATRVVNIFATGEAYALATGGSRTAAESHRISAAGALTVSPDGVRAIQYQAISPATGVAPTMIELFTGAGTPLAQPTAVDGPFALADWLPDGRFVMVGRGVWIGSGDGSAMRKIADAAGAAGGLPWTAVPSVAGDRVAIWAYNTDGHVAVVDLKDGTVTRVAGPFRRYGADATVSLAWSRDGTMLAGIDSDVEGGATKARVRIVEVATGKTVRTIEGGAVRISAFATGELMVTRDAGEQGAGARLLGILMGFDGVEHRRFSGCAWSMSPDARYILQSECGGAGYSGFTIFELIANARPPTSFALSGQFGRYLSSGRLVFY
ncbi:MAG: hypothetical protein ABI888_00155 [Chloroflexota bacterium]